MVGDGYWLNFQTLVPEATRAKINKAGRAKKAMIRFSSWRCRLSPERRVSASMVPKAYLWVRPQTYLRQEII
jgi:hypothetical protein